jgi:hypothetical protein
MSLPEHRRAFTGRTQSSAWDAIQYAQAIESHRVESVLGTLLRGAALVAAVAAVGLVFAGVARHA